MLGLSFRKEVIRFSTKHWLWLVVEVAPTQTTTTTKMGITIVIVCCSIRPMEPCHYRPFSTTGHKQTQTQTTIYKVTIITAVITATVISSSWWTEHGPKRRRWFKIHTGHFGVFHESCSTTRPIVCSIRFVKNQRGIVRRRSRRFLVRFDCWEPRHHHHHLTSVAVAAQLVGEQIPWNEAYRQWSTDSYDLLWTMRILDHAIIERTTTTRTTIPPPFLKERLDDESEN